MDNPRPIECVLDGFDGPKEAIATPPKDGVIWSLKATDGSISIMVGQAVIMRKFEQETKPTFYYS